jgi:ribosomal protein S9
MPLGNAVTYGKINEVYATLIIEKRGKGTIEINTKDTQAYFNGTPILDFTSSFKPIEL